MPVVPAMPVMSVMPVSDIARVVDTLVQENRMLREDNARLKRRVNWLVRALRRRKPDMGLARI